MAKKTEAAKETWHNRLLDERGGMMHLSVIRAFGDPNHLDAFGDPIDRPQNSMYWEEANLAYRLYLERKVSRLASMSDPMDGTKDPDLYKTDAKQREEMYAKNPFCFGATHFDTGSGLMTIPLDHEGNPWLAIKEGSTAEGASKFVFVPEEFKDSRIIARKQEDIASEWTPLGPGRIIPKRRYEQEQDEKHWYILKSGEGVRVNVIQQYVDFFSGRIYNPGENVLMYAEEADRAKREGYATAEPIVKMSALVKFEDDFIQAYHNPHVKAWPRRAGETFFATSERVEQLREKGVAVPAEEADQYRIASPSYFEGKTTVSGDSLVPGKVKVW